MVRPHSQSKTENRGIGIVFHLGHWSKSACFIYETVDSRSFGVKWWCVMNHELWAHISMLAFKYFPEEATVIDKVNTMYKFGIWTCAALNINYAVEPHIDRFDQALGVTASIVFGTFIGGEFCFTDECICIPFQGFSLLLFRSKEYKHHVADFIGFRNSVSLFTPNATIKLCE
jgi:hypothetical protein